MHTATVYNRVAFASTSEARLTAFRKQNRACVRRPESPSDSCIVELTTSVPQRAATAGVTGADSASTGRDKGDASPELKLGTCTSANWSRVDLKCRKSQRRTNEIAGVKVQEWTMTDE